jgi:hypothetical protein
LGSVISGLVGLGSLIKGFFDLRFSFAIILHFSRLLYNPLFGYRGLCLKKRGGKAAPRCWFG